LSDHQLDLCFII